MASSSHAKEHQAKISYARVAGWIWTPI